MIIAYWPLIVAIVGALVFLLAKKSPDARELGRIAYAVGLLVFVFVTLAHKSLTLGD